jgi:diguanylate cyclase (GGDEF)-like protein
MTASDEGGRFVTLRARLSAAFLAVVLGPVLIGAVWAGATVTAGDRAKALDQLRLAVVTVRGGVTGLCAQLRTSAQAVALLTDGGHNPAAASTVVGRGMAGAVALTDPEGNSVGTASSAPAQPWATCDQPATGTSGRYTAIAARVEMRDEQGALLGYAYALQPLSPSTLTNFAAGTGAHVFLAGGHPTGGNHHPSTRRLISRLSPAVDEPLPLAVSTPRPDPGMLYLVLLGAVVLAAMGAVGMAWWLSGSTTRPLFELAQAADQVADGNLTARVPVRGHDEVSRLASTFNRMTRETQAYVEALTASRDQLRGHLELLGDTLSSTHDLSRILTVILSTARTATGARSGVVLLVEGGELVGDGLRLPLGPGLVGGVAESGKPRCGRVERDGPVLAPGEPRCRTYVAVPFRGPGPDSVRGVLALYDRLGDDEFDDADLRTLRTFAGQAAIAVENVRLHEEAQRLSHTDPLTGLSNYRTLKESLRREVERAHRFGRRLAVLVLDLDRFKEVNDTYGHPAGDVVLTEFARRLRAEIREVDLAFRQGGEEFVLLLPETDEVGGSAVADRLCTAVRSAPVLVPARLPAARHGAAGTGRAAQVSVTVSIGIAVFPDHGSTGGAVLEAADAALYVAKAAGRDGYQAAPRTVEVAG